ncbi:MAG: MBOAT family protein, partial [Candidatus Cloacimonetes bacterium]|nr:MBOAT family protein [Candidatus Cloacimonadota bacterium]
GLFEKIVLADGVFAPVANQFFADGNISSAQAWVGTIAFTGQIFCDFAGYSTCAIGAALCLGFRLPTNFRNPYSSIGFSDFWQRWHISLSTWLRDYLYIPLGGNRKGVLFTYRNLFLTMLIGGLWHGAAWTFIIWGGLHGAYLVTERFLKKTRRQLWFVPNLIIVFFSWFITLIAVMYAWVWFRAESVSQAVLFTLKLINLEATISSYSTIGTQGRISLCVFLVLVLVHILFKNTLFEELICKLKPIFLIVLITSLIVSISLTPGGSNAFIYFQF